MIYIIRPKPGPVAKNATPRPSDWESNPRPLDYQTSALPTELQKPLPTTWATIISTLEFPTHNLKISSIDNECKCQILLLIGEIVPFKPRTTYVYM